MPPRLFARYWTPGLGRSQTTDWELEHAHFVERFQVFIIIVLGTSITATGASASHAGLGGDRIGAIVVAFAMTAALWWLYFDRVAARSAEDFASAEQDRGRLGRDAFTYLHIPIVAGIILAAVANKIVVAHPATVPDARQLMAIAGGPALYLLGHLAFRARMTATLSLTRAAAIGLIAGAGAIGTILPAIATEALITAVLIAAAIVELRRGPSDDEAASSSPRRAARRDQ